jgi:hypothetical protein
MKILYRPQRGGLAEAMKEVKKFSSVKEMTEYLVEYHGNAFDASDVYISYYGYDERIGWETYIVTVSRYYDEDYLEKYHCPQAIGFCTFVERRISK